MSKKILLLALCSFAILSACAEDDVYPVTGEECGPDDPVKSVDANMANCLPAG